LNLYHYSANAFDVIKSKRAQGTATPEEIKKAEEQARRILMPGATYVDSISFFFEPIPSEIMHQIYGEGHPVWFEGNKLYEYEVKMDLLPQRILYEVVESERELVALDKFVKDHNWVEDDPVLLKKWFAFILNEKLKWGEYGNDRSKLFLQAKKNSGNLTTNFLKAAQREDFKDNFRKYAASVPHLMMYPEDGTVRYEIMSLVTIGKKGSKFLKRFDD
jgi:hypothetical protein